MDLRKIQDRNRFQSPLGEVVKETSSCCSIASSQPQCVSIPSRGSGKGDEAKAKAEKAANAELRFNPLSGKW